MGAESADPLRKLREELRQQRLDGFIIPRADEHLGEYVPPSAERLAWLTGFTGSAGLAIVLEGEAAVFTDGRYVMQLAAETDGNEWQQLHIIREPPARWLAANAPAGAKIGYDPLLISEEGLASYIDAGVNMVAVDQNPIDLVWIGRPPPPISPAVAHPLEYSGRSSDEKRQHIAAILRDAKHDAAVISDPASIAWLLNIRGGDLRYTPFALGFALIYADGTTELFMNPAKLSELTPKLLGNAVSVAGQDGLGSALARLSGRRVRVDVAGSPAWFSQRLRQVGGIVVTAPDPCLLPKACKNEVEQQGVRNAHRRDAVAVCRFLHALMDVGVCGGETEMSAAAKLLAFREQVTAFRGESFPAISGAGENGAIIHYRVSDRSNRPIRRNELYLIDSGAQYPDGTTDITRTIWTGPAVPPVEIREHVTRVLKGHIAIATLVFPDGVTGVHVDAFARRALWQVGLDYDHGTGHGVGSYLSVHEGPVSLSRLARPIPIAPGMVLSDEPGLYLAGKYGIRMENLLLVGRVEQFGTGRAFMRFETLTLAPFDRRLLLPELLEVSELAWLNEYHARVLAEVGPHLDPRARAWLSESCAPIL